MGNIKLDIDKKIDTLGFHGQKQHYIILFSSSIWGGLCVSALKTPVAYPEAQFTKHIADDLRISKVTTQLTETTYENNKHMALTTCHVSP